MIACQILAQAYSSYHISSSSCLLRCIQLWHGPCLHLHPASGCIPYEVPKANSAMVATRRSLRPSVLRPHRSLDVTVPMPSLATLPGCTETPAMSRQPDGRSCVETSYRAAQLHVDRPIDHIRKNTNDTPRAAFWENVVGLSHRRAQETCLVAANVALFLLNKI